MKNTIYYTLQTFDKWDIVSDYESDDTTVTLLDAKKNVVAEFNYPGFTLGDFNLFKNGASLKRVLSENYRRKYW